MVLHDGLRFAVSAQDLDLLAILTADGPPPPASPAPQAQHSHSHPHPPRAHAQLPTPASRRAKLPDRRPPPDPLLVAAAASAGSPDMTRAHFLHEYYPHTLAYSSCDDEAYHLSPRPPHLPRPRMQSQQAPRRVRLAAEATARARLAASAPMPARTAASAGRRQSISDPAAVARLLRQPTAAIPTSPLFPASPAAAATATASTSELPPLVVQCQVRTRIPTPHGHVFLHLYKNNHDEKEHLCFIADQAQMDARPGDALPLTSVPFLRSRTLDASWRDGETEMERIVRGAYVGRLSASTVTPSVPHPDASTASLEPPLVRIHSECFTGEVIGSQRCDCGEQLDEAFRLISSMRRGIVVYLRQEGRGIGLLEKLRAYNLQDLGHDTVTANLLLGHGADLRTYDIAGAILRDLDVPAVRLLTNNPDKIEQIEKEGVTVVERVAMVPRSWTTPLPRKAHRRRRRPILSGAALLAAAELSLASTTASSDGGDLSSDDDTDESDEEHNLRRAGVGMIGASVTRSVELDKYLRTKVERMGHLLAVPPTPPVSRADSRAGGRKHRHGRALEDSILSVRTDEGSLECGSGCEQCGEEKGVESEADH